VLKPAGQFSRVRRDYAEATNGTEMMRFLTPWHRSTLRTVRRSPSVMRRLVRARVGLGCLGDESSAPARLSVWNLRIRARTGR
jgi:hypothetical protein